MDTSLPVEVTAAAVLATLRTVPVVSDDVVSVSAVSVASVPHAQVCA
jgi:hypothetical protein